MIRSVLRSRNFERSQQSLEEIDRRASSLLRELSNLLPEHEPGAVFTPRMFESFRELYGADLLEAAALAILLIPEIGLQHETFAAIDRGARTSISRDSVFWVYLKGRLSLAALWSNDLDNSEEFLEEAEFLLSGSEPLAARELAWPLIGLIRGLLEQRRGDFQHAASMLEDALEMAKHQGNRIAAALAGEWGSLLWSSGQVERALEIHTDAEIRAAAAQGASHCLFRSHISAAKCAIDLGDFETAERELETADRIQQESDAIHPFYRGYYLLRLGEFHLASRAEEQRGLDLLDSARVLFERLDPPHHAGVFESKIELARHTLRFDDPRESMPILRNMLDEATELECHEARSKILLLESQLYVSDNPPEESAYEDLAVRLSLINNPAQMLEACANLYLYSLRYLDESQQAFMMERIRRLEDVLDHRWYRDLYERHVERRYYWAVEGRLAEYLESDEKLFATEGDSDREEDV